MRPTSPLSRRDMMKLSACGTFGASMSRWLPALAEEASQAPGRRRSVILLWMTGGPSQTDTFDMKPGHENGGSFKPIETSVPGIQICEHLPNVAKMMHHCVPIRSMSTKEGDHTRATYLLRTGNLPQGPIDYPTLGSLFSKELGQENSDLPNFVAVAPYTQFSPAAYGPGFLGPNFAPLIVGDANRPAPTANGMAYDQSLAVKNLALPQGIDIARADARLSLLGDLENDFGAERPGLTSASHRSAYAAAVRMMRSEAVKAFNLDDEPASLREAYGRNQFGQACLLARRLVERGVPFVEVSLNGVGNNQTFAWDTHTQNFTALKSLLQVLDPAWATLMTDLQSRGLLDSTLILWMGEFGRTPKINPQIGRDHFPNAWSSVLCGGGIKAGQAIGRTTADGMKVEDRPVSVQDLFATMCQVLGLDSMKQNISNVGRPIRLADPSAKPITEIL
ncbi:DUF1501 domain-containing protein [Schlesneria paludicola]|uniref:DUF1501 domain-containing protein n=1 Tax=Schlesneria paludicola TaxID=360056 RepID=UPI00029A0891|nr:DUF1501 domain-containing protein [Schlesneria paludicola]